MAKKGTMRKVGLWLLLIQFSVLTHGQNPLNQEIDFSVTNISISKALEALSEQSSIPFTFSSDFFKRKQSVSINAEDQSIKDVLKKLLKRTEVDFKFLDDHIVFFRKPFVPLKKYTFSGYLEDSETGERLVAANVYSKTHLKGTVSNEYGFFSMTLPEGEADLMASYLGYSAFSEKINLSKNLTQNIKLKPSVTLAEIIVTPNDSFSNTKVLSGQQKISMHHAKSMPDLGGESDIIRMVQLLPGVQSGADGFGGLFVRGGGVDQNLMLVDGVPIYNAMHLLGVFSIYNTDALRSATFLKGGFPARYGGRNSSVFDVRTKEGNQRKFSGEAGLSLVTGKLRLETPILNKKGAILLAARTNVVDFFIEPFTKKLLQVDDTYEGSDFVDFNAKFNYTFSPNNRIFLSYYSGGDDLRTNSEDLDWGDFEDSAIDILELESKMSWGNKIGALRWNHLFNDKLFSNTTATLSNYSFLNRSLTEYLFFDEEEMDWVEDFDYISFGSDLTDWTLKTDFDFVPSLKHHLRFGVGFTRHGFLSGPTFFDEFEDLDETQYDSLSLDDLAQLENLIEQFGSEYYGYLEDEMEISEKWKANIGLRISGFFNEENHWLNLEPRINTNYQLADGINLSASYSKMTQYLHLISFTGFGLPGDIWAMSESDMPPQKTWQTTLGLNFKLPKQVDFSIEGYYKKMNNLLHLPTDYDPYDDAVEFDDVELYKGKGWGYGIEFLLKKEAGKTGGWLSYSLSWSERQFDKLNLGNRFPFHQDRRHLVNLALYHRLTNQLELGANFVYGSANPYVLVEGDLVFGELLPLYEDVNPNGQRNKLRQKPYHRLDLGLKYNFGKRKLRHYLKAGVYNLYNRKNIAYNQLSTSLFEEKEINAISILGVQPSLGYSLKF
jgi:outer membrane receptor for ferrienterochelin and colicin